MLAAHTRVRDLFFQQNLPLTEDFFFLSRTFFFLPGSLLFSPSLSLAVGATCLI